MLTEVDGCVYDAEQLPHSHGFSDLDPVAREAFVNHIHLVGPQREAQADQIVSSWMAEFRRRWPARTFRIYRETAEGEVTIRFHQVRPGVPNWAEACARILEVGGTR